MRASSCSIRHRRGRRPARALPAWLLLVICLARYARCEQPRYTMDAQAAKLQRRADGSCDGASTNASRCQRPEAWPRARKTTHERKSRAIESFGVLRGCGTATNNDECALSALSLRHFSPGVHQKLFAGDGCAWRGRTLMANADLENSWKQTTEAGRAR